MHYPPRGSMQLLALLSTGDFAAAERVRADYLPLEDLRDAISPIRVLHDAWQKTRLHVPMQPIRVYHKRTSMPAVRRHCFKSGMSMVPE